MTNLIVSPGTRSRVLSAHAKAIIARVPFSALPHWPRPDYSWVTVDFPQQITEGVYYV